MLVEGGGETFPTVASASHYLGHLNAMKTALSVEENLDFWRAFQGEAGLSVEEALEMVAPLEAEEGKLTALLERG